MADILNPRKYYFQTLKDKQEENAVKYFDALAEKSGIDIESNRITVKEIRVKEEELDNLTKKQRKKKALKGFFIFLTILFFLASISSVLSAIEEWLPIPASVISCILSLIAAIVFIIVIVKKINKEIMSMEEVANTLRAALNKLYKLSWNSMANLNSLFDDDMAQEVFNMSIDDFIKLDKVFDIDKYAYLVQKYGFSPQTKENSSTVLAKSGQILGNPFVLYKTYNMRMVPTTYTGTLTIHWTTTVHTDSGTRIEHHTQTLVATVTEPAPNYFYETRMVYGNEAAPRLTFSRKPSGSSEMSEKKREKVVKKTSKKLDKKARKELMDDDPTTNYTRFSHDEFEALFGGTNRDNEVEYRLLFTPLAIQNELDLINNPEPYGDDFSFYKNKNLNTIISSHSQRMEYDASADIFKSYSFDISRDKFLKHCRDYFAGIYFDLAPLISIPLYQQTKSPEFIYGHDYEANYSPYEHESAANMFDPRVFQNEETDTNVILKTTFVNKDKNADVIGVKAHSFRKDRRISYIAKMGGDGRMHNVPVEWFEYIPLEADNVIEFTTVNGSRKEFIQNKSNDSFNNFMNNFSDNTYAYKRGFIATLLNKEEVKESFSKVSDYFKGIYNNSSVLNNSNIQNSQNSNKK